MQEITLIQRERYSGLGTTSFWTLSWKTETGASFVKEFSLFEEASRFIEGDLGK